ncbi:MAG TPA: ComF family protein [Candidatus Eisenbacteria bacterium]|nr:ComF family protein [Candidatus Eisenbacteria bacterium]
MGWWWWEDAIDAILDRRCPGCAGRIARGREVCDACEALIPRSGTVLCLACLHGDPQADLPAGGACAKHGSSRLAIAGPHYEPTLERILHAYKYEGAHRLAPWMADLLPEPPGKGTAAWREYLLVPVPLHPARRTKRGFDQALRMAEIASGRWGIPLGHLLERVRDHEPQARLDGARRRMNVRGAFRAVTPSLANGRPILLVDDVVTTGSTLLEAASALEEAGASWILALTAAHGGADADGEGETRRAKPKS